MGYKIVIPVIAIVAVLFSSGLAVDAFATHEFERGKAAYMFDCSGVNGGNINFHPQVKQFLEKNNGSYHPCGYNWMYQAINATGNNWGYHQNDLGQVGDGVEGPCNNQTHCHNGKPVTHFALTNPHGWDKFIDQYKSSTKNSKMPELASSKNTKLILRGYSWGGGAATMLATEVDRDIDLVFLIDPVGPSGFRATLVKECGTEEFWLPPPILLLSCTIIGADRVFPDKVTQVINWFQKEAPFPFDFGTVGGFANPNNNYEEHVFDCPNATDPPQATDPKCHSTIEGQISIFNDFKEELQSMNSEPFFQPGILPTEIILNEGDVDSWPIHTPDFKTKYEELHQMDMTFRDLTTSNYLKFDIDIDQGFLDIINNNHNRLRSGSFDLNTYDNFTTNIILQVEDNGFPCGGCTDWTAAHLAAQENPPRPVAFDTTLGNGIGEDDAMGAKGYWDIESIPVTVHNVKPTIENFEMIMAGFNAIMLLDTSDPSIRDVEAGFYYTIDWGDGIVEIIHEDALALIKHEYTISGKYDITVFATDKDGDDSDTPPPVTVYTPFVKLLDDFDDLVTDGTLNNGQGNSFKSKINAIIKSIDKGNLTPACNVAEALINEVEAFVQSGKLTQQQADELFEEIEKSKDQLGCNGSIIVVQKQTTPVDARPAQFTFTGDVAGTIGDGEQIQVNVLPGQYTSTEPPIGDGWEPVEIICTDKNSIGAIPTATFNVEEDEYVVCIFINKDFDANEEQLSQTSSRGGNSASDSANTQARFNSFSGQPSDNITDDKKGGGGDEHLTRPTFGVSHETFETIVDSGFRFNDQSFTINDNFHTPFAQQTVNIGEVNTFEAKIYADKRLKIQEFLFGIPNVGDAHLAELGVEVWYDYNGEIEDVKAIQKSNVIDKETIVATHEKTKCQATDIEQKCDTTNVSMVFLEPLKDKVMAVKAIDYKNRYQITYLNEGVEIAGESLNPMNTFLIPSKVKGEGLVQVTQTAKYSPYWESDDGRTFEMNSFGSFKQINQTFERFEDTGNPYTRVHSGFGGIIAYEQKRANQVFDSNEYISELPDSFGYIFPEPYDRMTDDMKAKMLEQEEIAKKIIEESKVQARW